MMRIKAVLERQMERLISAKLDTQGWEEGT